MNSWTPAQDNQNGFRNGTCLTPREKLRRRFDANANLHVRTLHWNINFLHRRVWNEILILEIFYSFFWNTLFFTVPSLWIMADHSALMSRKLLKIFLFFFKLVFIFRALILLPPKHYLCLPPYTVTKNASNIIYILISKENTSNSLKK